MSMRDKRIKPGSSLPDRELEVLVYMCKGFHAPEIAGFLGISKHTVINYMRQMYLRLGVSGAAEATYWAGKTGIEA